MADIVPVTQEHLNRIGLGKLPMTIKGLALVDNDTVLAVGGIYPDAGHWVLASRLSDELRTCMRSGRHTRTFLRAARAMLALAATRRMPIYSVADPEHAGSTNLLEHLGFAHETGSDTVYKWQISA